MTQAKTLCHHFLRLISKYRTQDLKARLSFYQPTEWNQRGPDGYSRKYMCNRREDCRLNKKCTCHYAKTTHQLSTTVQSRKETNAAMQPNTVAASKSTWSVEGFFFYLWDGNWQERKKQINAIAPSGMQRARARTIPFTSSKPARRWRFSFWYARAIIKCNNTKTTNVPLHNSTIKYFPRLIRYVRNATTYSSCFFMKRSSVISELSRSSKAWNTERVDNGKSDE